MKRFVSPILAPWCTLFALTHTFAQVPSAGSFQQNIDNQVRQSPLPLKPGPQPLTEPNTTPTNGPEFKLKRINFSGNTLLTNAQIELLIAPYLNRSIDFGQLQILANSLEDIYRKLGRMSRVVIPEQTILNSTLSLQIEEAHWGEVKVRGDTIGVNPERIGRTVGEGQTPNELLNLTLLERGVLLADDLPGVKVSALFSQSTTPLTTDVIADVSNNPPYSWSVQADNSGPTSIGANRFIANLALSTPLGIGDLLNGTYLGSNGTQYGRLSYSLPVAYDGLRVGVNVSSMNYKLVSAEFMALGATGSSYSQGLEALYPVIRSKSTNLYFGLNTDYRKFNNSNSSNGLLSQYSVMDYSASLFINTFDTLGGQGANNLAVVLTNGTTDLSGSPNQAAVLSSSNSQGEFTKTRYTANRTQSLDQSLSAYASITGQASGANLDPSEMFYLGGINAVRAYPTNEGAGSQGGIATLELRKTLSYSANAALFYDYGRVQVNPNNAYAVAGYLNSYDQKGAGLSMGIKANSRVDLKAVWAKRIGADSNLTRNGTYQNGSTGSTQLWLLASVGF